MKNNCVKLTLLLLACLSLTGFKAAAAAPDFYSVAPDTLPVPKVKNMLYYVQRDPNTNTVVYQLNRSANGAINEAEPVQVFWIRYAEGGARKELNYIQRKFAYGLNTRKLGKDNFELKFVCYNKLALHLRRSKDGQYHAYAKINGQEAILERVFVRVEGGSFWVPNVLYVELRGKDAASGKLVTERFKP
ncbi:DUF4833 domain-containing protein [Pontibacter beigongshangensis]|uniref:DUF4833 domain-containing protein n=1 Tax=Pontibacter beigongshangensis TaxID=2574733 RepID=UPI00293B9ACC|nr:DUF4833 domain-containing protein [Pontibacter beigongshangensis]